METIYIGAHLDDVPLSCGGQINQRIQNNEKVTALTVFAGIPELKEPVSKLIQEMYDLWGNLENMTEMRRLEDRNAVKTLGAECVHLDFLDCIYRKDEKTGEYYFLSSKDVMGQIKPQDISLPAKIAGQIEKMYPSKKKVRIFGPLAVGGHNDHKITHLALLELKKRGYETVLFEDYPYAEKEGEMEKALEALPDASHWKSRIIKLSEENILARIKCTACYDSQLVMLFESPEKLTDRVKGFIEKTGGERIWEFKQS